MSSPPPNSYGTSLIHTVLRENIFFWGKYKSLYLVESNDGHWISVSALGRCLRGHPKPNRQVVHAIHNHTLAITDIVILYTTLAITDIAHNIH